MSFNLLLLANYNAIKSRDIFTKLEFTLETKRGIMLIRGKKGTFFIQTTKRGIMLFRGIKGKFFFKHKTIHLEAFFP